MKNFTRLKVQKNAYEVVTHMLFSDYEVWSRPKLVFHDKSKALNDILRAISIKKSKNILF